MSNIHSTTCETVPNTNDHELNNDNPMKRSFNDMQTETMVENFLGTVRTTPLDVIVEDLNEENFDELDGLVQSTK